MFGMRHSLQLADVFFFKNKIATVAAAVVDTHSIGMGMDITGEQSSETAAAPAFFYSHFYFSKELSCSTF